MRPEDLPPTWDERATLLTMLAYTRDCALQHLDDLDPVHLGAAPLPTSPLMTIGGVLNHLRWVEHSWIETRFVDGPDLGPWTADEPDKEFSDGALLSADQLREGYAAQAAVTERLIDGVDLDALSALPLRRGRTPTLRWVLQHLVEENARHNGHLDLLRELADGQVFRS